MQSGLGLISPTILAKRFNDLAEAGVVIRKRRCGQRGHEYLLTTMGRELLPIVMQLGEWGMRWARGAMPDKDLDVELLMLYLQRSIRAEALPGKATVIRFNFSDLKGMNDWWLRVSGDTVDVCVKDPGREVDIHLATDLRTMIQVWMGDISLRTAVAEGRMKMVGPSALTRDIKSWLAPHALSGIRPAREIA